MDKTGLGQGQTLRLAKLLDPDKVMLINSMPFNGNPQYPEWYHDYTKQYVTGFPDNVQVSQFLEGLDVVISCETFYRNTFTREARDRRVETILIANPEFFDWFNPAWAFVPLPDKVVVPSPWLLDRMNMIVDTTVLPTPIHEYEFSRVAKHNMKRKGRKFLFINGKTAVEDRNGLESLYRAMELAKGDFTVTVKAQHDIKRHPDPRLIYDFSNPDNQADLYHDFDALIQPRRYGGQTLSMTEALSSALPVLMTDISPNNQTLPKEWLVPAEKKGVLHTRLDIDVYDADARALANKLQNMDVTPKAKKKALLLSRNYSAEHLKPEYWELIG